MRPPGPAGSAASASSTRLPPVDAAQPAPDGPLPAPSSSTEPPRLDPRDIPDGYGKRELWGEPMRKSLAPVRRRRGRKRSRRLSDIKSLFLSKYTRTAPVPVAGGPRRGAMHADEPPLTGEPHPKVWDLICVGTGLAETMLARCVPRVPRRPTRRHGLFSS